MGSVPENFHGVKGKSGRKSMYQEKMDAEFLAKMFFEDQDEEDLIKQIESGKFSIKTRLLLKAMEGNEKVMLEFFKKIYPDKIESTIQDDRVEEALKSLKELGNEDKDVQSSGDTVQTGEQAPDNTTKV